MAYSKQTFSNQGVPTLVQAGATKLVLAYAAHKNDVDLWLHLYDAADPADVEPGETPSIPFVVSAGDGTQHGGVMLDFPSPPGRAGAMEFAEGLCFLLATTEDASEIVVVDDEATGDGVPTHAGRVNLVWA